MESIENIGSTFYFTVPITNQKNLKVAERLQKKEIVSMSKTANISKKIKILIVEDDGSSAIYLTTVLEGMNCEILNAYNGAEAVEICQNNSDIEIVFMDLKMPVIDGYRATSKIREFNKDVFIIAQSAYAFASDEEKALQVGCNTYLSKPIQKEKVIELLENYVNITKEINTNEMF